MDTQKRVNKKTKGRGFKGSYDEDRVGRSGQFEAVEADDAASKTSTAQKSVEVPSSFVPSLDSSLVLKHNHETGLDCVRDGRARGGAGRRLV